MNCPLSVAHEMSAFNRAGIIQAFYLKGAFYELSPVPMGADHENPRCLFKSTAQENHLA